MSKLNTENPDFLVWEHEKIRFDILGGIRLEGLDRLRVTLRVQFDQVIIRHNIDLYNDNQLTQLVRKCAERFEMSSTYMYPVVGQLVNLLEEYRIKTIQSEADSQKTKTKVLTEQEVAAATELLKSEHLLSKINALIGQAGVIGEVDNRLLMYIIFTSRLMENPLHIISMGASGTGKSHLQESVAALFPEEETLSVTDLTPSSFYYFKPNELSHKLILIEDLDGADSALYPLRELQSKKMITKTFVEKTRQGMRTTSRTVYGPVCVAGCTTREQVYEDNSNRSFLIYIDQSRTQDELIMAYQRAVSKGDVDNSKSMQVKELLKNAQRMLEPIKVVNPFASQLLLPESVFKPRRTNAHYLHFIEAVTFLNQFQREQKVEKDTGEQWIETTLEDVEVANDLLKDILLRKSDRLSPATRRYFEQLKVYLKNRQSGTDFETLHIALAFKRPIPTIRRYHQTLFNNGYLQAKTKEGSRTIIYQILDPKEYVKLENGIKNDLDQALNHLKQGKISQKSKRINKK